MRDKLDLDPFQAEDDAATPLTNDEKTGLLPSWVTYRHELNEVEQANIAKGTQWGFRQKRRELLNERFVLDLHQQMLGEVWAWAGQYRTTERNIGVPAWRIATDLHGLLDDAQFWEEQSVFRPDELSVRFHHRLVAIHPFPNGNGRHARLMADLLVTRLGGTAFTWGGGSMTRASDLRTQYITALRQGDSHEFAALLEFARA